MDSSKIDPHLYLKLASLGLHESAPKRYLDRFSRIHRCNGYQCFSMERTITKIVSSHWGIGAPYVDIHTRVSPQTVSRSIQPSLQGTRTRPTDRQTDRPTTLRAWQQATIVVSGLKMDCYKSVELTLSGDFELSVTHRRTFLSRHNS